MSSYSSLSSYLLAVKLRSSKTLLVEGVSDKKVISHYILKRNHIDNTSADYCIDDASLIDDKTLGPIGAKDKVKSIASQLAAPNFRCLIDREWDGLNSTSMEFEPITHPQNTFITRGHSIENYWFTPAAFIEFIIHTHHAATTNEYLRKIESLYLKILQFAAAYSLACRQLSIIARANDILCHTNIELQENGFIAKPCLDGKIATRGQQCELRNTTNGLIAQAQSLEISKLQWICHGHLGEQAIRSCIALLAQLEGYDAQVIESIEYGHKAEKLKLDSDHVTSLPADVSMPLSEVLQWVRAG